MRAIDPATSKRLTDGEAPSPALYLSDRLLVRAADRDGGPPALDLLGKALSELDLTYEVTSPDDGQRQAPEVRTWGTSITLRSTRSPIDPIDAWTVLQELRAAGSPIVDDLSLEHVLRPADGYWGGIGGYWGGIGGYWGGIGGYWGGIAGSALQEYAVPGRGGRMPISLALPDPALRAQKLERPPVIAVPDTAIARHPWFTSDRRVVRLRMKNGKLVPAPAPREEPLGFGESSDRADPPGLLEGHATFIAGLIRQGCPEATIVSIPVMGDDGIVDEAVMLDVLEALLDRHRRGQDGGASEDVIDVLSLSLGYYAEDSTYRTGPVAEMLQRFAEQGVAVVAGVGNDGTRAPFVPAALAADTPAPILPTSNPPLASVGACNPNGTTVALFSNPLAIVSAVRMGVSVVSTLPLTNGMGQPSQRVEDGRTVRCTVDPDDYTGGFGVWSGTSFSTPVFAAELAVTLIEEGNLTDVSGPAMRQRAIRALDTCTKRVTP